jgi:hypothetical protein
VVALVGGAAGASSWCHPRTIPLVERAGKKKKKKKKDCAASGGGGGGGGGAEFRLLARVVVVAAAASSPGSHADPAPTDAAGGPIAILRARDADEAGRWADAIDAVGERERRRLLLLPRPRPQRRSPQRGRPPPLARDPAAGPSSCDSGRDETTRPDEDCGDDAGMGDGRRRGLLDRSSLPSGTATADRPRVDCGSQTVDLGIVLAASEGLFDREEEEEEEGGRCTESSEAGGDTAGEDQDGKTTTTTTTTAAAGEEEKEGADGGPKPKDDPKYEKYRRMMRMGLPKEAARHAMIRDNLDPRCVRYISMCRSPSGGASARPLCRRPRIIFYRPSTFRAASWIRIRRSRHSNANFVLLPAMDSKVGTTPVLLPSRILIAALGPSRKGRTILK